MDAVRSLHAARKRFTHDVRQALGQVPPEIANSAVGHAILAEALIQLAADILMRQQNEAFMGEMMRSLGQKVLTRQLE